jgi:hypothetical protein
MKILRLLFFSLLTLFAIVCFIGILLPSTVLVSRAVNISAPVDSIRPHLDNIPAWKEWMEGMNGAVVAIQSPVQANLAGTEVAITQISDSSIVSVWKGRSGNPQTSTFRLIGGNSGGITVVQWEFIQHLKWYPWERIASIMNDKILGTLMERNLNTLKQKAENR